MNIKISKRVLKIKIFIILGILFYKFAGLCANKIGLNTEVGPNAGLSIGQQMGQASGPSIGKLGIGMAISGQAESEITKYPVMEKVTIYSKKSENSNEKIIRKGLLAKSPNAKANILLCHGYTCDKTDIGFLRYIFKDCNCLTFDFRAHGENVDGQCCTLGKNEAYDVIAAANFLKTHPDTKDKPTLVYAFSMGAVAAIEAQAKVKAESLQTFSDILGNNINGNIIANAGKNCSIKFIETQGKTGSLFDAMILDCPFDSTENVINRGLDNKKIILFGYQFDIPGKAILKKYSLHPYVQSFVKALLKSVAQFDGKVINTLVCPVFTAESIKKVSVPCLFIHCKNDEKIAVDSIKSIYYNAASNYKKLWLTEGKSHFGSFFNNPEEYALRIRKFVTKVVDGKLDKKNKHKIIEELSEADIFKVAQVKNSQETLVVANLEKDVKSPERTECAIKSVCENTGVNASVAVTNKSVSEKSKSDNSGLNFVKNICENGGKNGK